MRIVALTRLAGWGPFSFCYQFMLCVQWSFAASDYLEISNANRTERMTCPKIFVNLFFAFDCTDGLLAPLYLLSSLGEVFFNMQIFQWNPMEIENAQKKID